MDIVPIKLVIFDLDGTLADTLDDIAAAVNAVLERHGLPPHEVTEYRGMVGNGFRLLMERAVPAEVKEDSARFEVLYTEAIEEYHVHALDSTTSFAGALPTLQALSNKKIALAVLSNKPERLTQQIVETLFPSIQFLAIWGERPERPKKPDPTAARALCTLAHARPYETLFVGDSATDIATAKAAGIVSVGALYGYRNKEELEQAGADFFIHALPELCQIIDRLNIHRL